jgi:hypothetical protein
MRLTSSSPQSAPPSPVVSTSTKLGATRYRLATHNFFIFPSRNPHLDLAGCVLLNLRLLLGQGHTMGITVSRPPLPFASPLRTTVNEPIRKSRLVQGVAARLLQMPYAERRTLIEAFIALIQHNVHGDTDLISPSRMSAEEALDSVTRY